MNTPEPTIHAQRLEFLGITAVPEHYHEQTDDSDGSLLIEAIVVLDSDADERLENAIRDRDETGYFDLTRVGVRDVPLRVRFGRCLWQRGESGRSHLLRLVADEDLDRDLSLWSLVDEPEKSRVASFALRADEGVDAILEELATAGVLTGEAIQRVKARIESVARRSRDLDEAVDVRTFLGD